MRLETSIDNPLQNLNEENLDIMALICFPKLFVHIKLNNHHGNNLKNYDIRDISYVDPELYTRPIV